MSADRWVRLFVAVYGDGVQDDHHWALWLEDVGIIQALSLAHWWVQVVPENDPRNSRTYAGSIYLTDIKESSFEAIANTARSLPLDRFNRWNCQDFIIDLLDALESRGTISLDDEYEKRKDRLRAHLHRRNN